MLVSQEEIAIKIGYKPTSTACIKKWLDANRIKYFPARDGTVVTTTDAINDALFGQRAKSADEIEF